MPLHTSHTCYPLFASLPFMHIQAIFWVVILWHWSWLCIFSLFPIFQRFIPGLLSQKSQVSRTNIKTAILQTPGPISTQNTIRSNWRFLRCTTKAQFVAAAVELQTSGLGSVVTLKSKRVVFVKKPGEEVQEILRCHPNLCLPELYNARYVMKPMKLIGWHIRNQLVERGLVRPEQMMWMSTNYEAGLGCC